MSALAGLWRFAGDDAAAGCARMLAVQAVYGPDKSGQWCGGDLALGRQLKRLLAEDAFDAQPVIAGGGRFVLVADLRLDNREELADALSMPRPELPGISDSALLARAYEKWEERCCERLLGDFAFAAWDAERRRLVLARDFAGGRPLHYHRQDRLFAFASMPKGLHALPEVPRAPDCDHMLAALMQQEVDETATLYAGIQRVLPGEALIVDRKGTTRVRHWQPAERLANVPKREEAVEGLRYHLDQAVRARLRGADRVAAHLSSGLDSSGVATAAALALGGRGEVVAFTAVPREGYSGAAPYGRIGDEGPAAAATAALYPNMEHVLVRPGPRSPLADIDRDMALADEPAVNLCNMRWMNAVHAEAEARGLKVLLTGARGNFAFSRDGLDTLPELLASGRWLRLAQEIAALRRAGYVTTAGAVSAVIRPYVPAGAWRALGRYAGRGPERWRYGAADRAQAAARPVSAPRQSGFESRAAAFRRLDQGKSQKAVLAAWGVDQRDPTGDRRLVEYCLALPGEYFLRNGVRRALARDALRGRVPDAVLDETRPGLQAVDWHEGAEADLGTFREELSRDASCAEVGRVLDVERLQKLVDEWPSGGWDDAATDKAYRLDLLRGISLAHFIRKASGSNA